MKRALWINLALLLAIILGLTITACQPTGTANSTGADTAAKCPLQQLGQSCAGDQASCPTLQGKDPCNSCVTKAKELQAKTAPAKCANADKCDKDGKCLGACTAKDQASCAMHKDGKCNCSKDGKCDCSKADCKCKSTK